ncbi:MAG: glycosyltransferase [Bacteroidetes bacterium]|nr:glycosyltransferase [Bacteroidota bacterium]
MRKLKILQAVYCLSRGGAEKLAIDITNELNKRENIEALLVSFDKTEDYEYDISEVNYKYCPSKTELSFFGKNKLSADSFKEVLKEFKPDIIHSHLFLSELITRFEISDNIKYVTHCHDNIVQFKKFDICSIFNRRKFTNFFERHYILNKYRQCNNNFIAISEDNQMYLRKNLPLIFQKNIFLHHNAIVFKNYFNPLKQITEKSDCIKLVSVGSFLDKKNQIFLIDVVKILINSGFNVHLTLLGEGKNRINIEKKINELELDQYVTLKGNVQNVEKYYFESDIYVHSAYYEPFGLVLLEAMAAGLPVVCLDGKGNRDIIEEGKNGFFIQNPDPNVFASKIITLINNKDLYRNIAEYAQNYASAFDMNIYIDKLVRFYNKIINGNS